MNYTYYNPAVYTPENHLEQVRELSKDNSFYNLYVKNAFKSRDEVMAHCAEGWEGYQEWWQDGKLMQGLTRPAAGYKPCPDEGVVQWGINWGDINGLTKEAVIAQYNKMFPDITLDKEDIKYNEKYGVYELHVHYDGRH